jgi:hypothetical protein
MLKVRSLMRPGALFACILALLLIPTALWASGGPQKPKEDRMSSSGRLAARVRAAIDATHGMHHVVAAAGDNCNNEPECEGEDEGGEEETGEEEGPDGGQAEVSIAVDSTGQHIVVGYNDTRGFALNPARISGVMLSDDGGQTFVDAGQLPSPGTDVIGTTRLPQVFGDPDVKYLGGCNFVYASILVKKFSATTAAQTMGIHVSNDCGHTWAGPYEVPPVTNPHGAVSGTGAPRDSADKEFIDADPETGRVLLSWSNFTPFAPGGVEISSTYSDNVLSAVPPTWSPRQIVGATSADGQSSVPRFAGNGSANAYMVWRRFPFPGTFGGNGNTIAFSRSADNGASWSTPVDLSAEFFTMDHVLGNDRINTSPSLAVDNSTSGHAGSIYVVYPDNDNHDGADIAFQRSTDGGLSFSAPVLLNSRPGNDRPQWFPWVTVDSSTGRVWVFYYDQGIATSGHRTEVTTTFSDDGGAHWSPPVPLTSRWFKAGWGNDTGQPNLGDYNQAVAQNGEIFAAYAVAFRPLLGFADGQPTSASMNTPDTVVRRIAENGGQINTIPVHITNVATFESGGNGFIDPGDTVRVQITIRNYDTNALSSRRVLGTTALLSSSTPGVTVSQAQSPYPNMQPGDTSTNTKDFVLQISPSFVPGTPIELSLSVRSNLHGDATLLHTLFTGTPAPTTIFSENFDSTTPGTLPAGWAPSHGGGSGIVPWTTRSTFCSTGSNGAFHTNDLTGIRFERLFSPTIAVPANAEYVTLDFDVCYDTEDDPAFNVIAYDGFTLRITDFTTGRLLRSELVEAFEDEFTTGTFEHFPKHFPRNSSSSYFQDMSVWAGDSLGVKHVHMRLPGMQGSTVQLRFEYAQDSGANCTLVRPGHTCGVLVDNIVMKSVVSTP